MSVAVVTGASRGIGRGIAVALADGGFDIVVGYNGNAAGADETAEEINLRGRRAVCVGGDVADGGTSKALMDAAVARLGGLDVWVNNAGVSLLAPVLSTSADDLRRMLDVNLLGVLHGSQAAARYFLDNQIAGRIVNIASDLGVAAFKYLGGYAATKFAVVGLTKTLALELADVGITVNAVCPGTAETDMVLAERAAEMTLLAASANDVRQSYLDAIPLGRFCDPADVGAVVAFLAGRGAAYLTGQSICINGGSVLH